MYACVHSTCCATHFHKRSWDHHLCLSSQQYLVSSAIHPCQPHTLQGITDTQCVMICIYVQCWIAPQRTSKGAICSPGLFRKMDILTNRAASVVLMHVVNKRHLANLDIFFRPKDSTSRGCIVLHTRIVKQCFCS